MHLLDDTSSINLPALMAAPGAPLQLGPGVWELRASTTVHVRLDAPATLQSPPLNPASPIRIVLERPTSVWGAADDVAGGRLHAVRLDDDDERGRP